MGAMSRRRPLAGKRGGDTSLPSSVRGGPAMPYVLEHRTSRVVGRGLPYPLGATPTATGVNFALYSKHAGEVFLLLFDTAGRGTASMLRLTHRAELVWQARRQGVGPGDLDPTKALWHCWSRERMGG